MTIYSDYPRSRSRSVSFRDPWTAGRSRSPLRSGARKTTEHIDDLSDRFGSTRLWSHDYPRSKIPPYMTERNGQSYAGELEDMVTPAFTRKESYVSPLSQEQVVFRVFGVTNTFNYSTLPTLRILIIVISRHPMSDVRFNRPLHNTTQLDDTQDSITTTHPSLSVLDHRLRNTRSPLVPEMVGSRVTSDGVVASLVPSELSTITRIGTTSTSVTMMNPSRLLGLAMVKNI